MWSRAKILWQHQKPIVRRVSAIVAGNALYAIALTQVLPPVTLRQPHNPVDAIVYAPVIEECIWRGPLIATRPTLQALGVLPHILSASILSVEANKNHSFQPLAAVSQCIGAAGVWSTIVHLISVDVRVLRWNRYILLGSSIFGFAAIHAPNFPMLDKAVLSTVVLSQGVGSIVQTFIALKYGLLYSIASHMAFNGLMLMTDQL